MSELRRTLSAFSITDDETKETIKKVFKDEKYLLDPHGAVGYLSLEKYLSDKPDQKGLFVETAHPVKFYDVVEPLIGQKIPLPASVAEIMEKHKTATKMDADYSFLKQFLLKLY